MSGAKLRSGSLSEFQPLGAEGAPVHASAEQIRAAVRRHLGPDQANLFAIPRVSDRGDSIDWYAPVPGDVIPWSSATDEEREDAKAMLVEAQAELRRHGEAMQQRNDRERQLFGRLLAQSMRIPDPSHVYLVEGRPVVTFWGFNAVGADPDIDVIPTLQTRMPPAVVAAAAAPAGTRFGLPWWLLLLLLLLLLGLLLFGLRGCFDSGPTIAVGPGGTSQVPELREDEPRDPDDRRGNLRLGPGGAILPGGGLRPGREGEGLVPEGGEGEPEIPPEEQVPSEIPPEEQAPPEIPPEEQTPPEIPPEEQAPRELPPPPQDPLEIPPEALENRSTDFLNGNWRSQTGLIDSETGRPLDLEYEFENGEGEARIRRNDGSVCRGRAGAGIRDGSLVIEGSEPIRCPDGVVYRPSTVTCSQDEGGPARCRGAYADGSGYSVGMSRREEGPQ